MFDDEIHACAEIHRLFHNMYKHVTSKFRNVLHGNHMKEIYQRNTSIFGQSSELKLESDNMEVNLLRHGESEYKAGNMLKYDAELTENGRQPSCQGNGTF